MERIPDLDRALTVDFDLDLLVERVSRAFDRERTLSPDRVLTCDLERS